MLHMRDQLVAAVKAHAQGEIAKHKVNVNVYLEHPVGIGEHSDITEAIQVELDKIIRQYKKEKRRRKSNLFQAKNLGLVDKNGNPLDVKQGQ